MTGNDRLGGEEEISLFALVTTLIRSRWRIARWMFAGGVIALLSVISKPPLYRASASFIPRGYDAGRSELTGLSSKLGVAVPSGNFTLSPDFYARLLKSRTLLRPITRNVFVIPEMRGRRVRFLDLFKIQGPSEASREEEGVELLKSLVNVSMNKVTGVVEVSVPTRWPSVSVTIASALLNGIDDYNRHTRQGQAAAERKFIEGRLAMASTDLRGAEDRFQMFLGTNRNLGTSPELALERDRLQREVVLRQQVVTSLMQADEEERIREVRDTPVITMVEQPMVQTRPEPRGRAKTTLVGLLLGGFIGVVSAFMSHAWARRRGMGSAEVDDFVNTLGEIGREISAPFRWLTRRTKA